ncbi:unnamed protein product [Microthlaspi erraticum]|uniref:F-box domain-containing protein n=1 Tax=Microthlaspi erraticum TaxID=1685480 RepID=A0A6D2HKL6_9BRAS|nr:unnamed protein product [Microthlaspi erraticum]
MKRCLRNGGLVSTEDRISHLPEALLLQILSLLATKDVVATSVLSKQWRSVWKMVPKLKFDYASNRSKHETFSGIVCRILLSHKAPVLQSLHIKFNVDDVDAAEIGMWIGIAYAHQLRELLFDVDSVKESSFKFPPSLYNCETLESLTLKTWVIVHVPSQARLKSLKALDLSVDFDDDESVVNLLSGCPKLENLVLYRGTQLNVETFTVAVPSLQRLTIYDYNEGQEVGGYVIKAPRLKYLEIDGFDSYDFCLIDNAPELVEANIIYVSGTVKENILGALTSAKRLILDLSPLEITFPTGSIFYRLVHLKLNAHKAEWWNLLVLLLNASPKLQVLELISRYRPEIVKDGVKWSQPKNVPECLLLHLQTFVWGGYKRLPEEGKEVANYILRNANHLKKAIFYTNPVLGIIGSPFDQDVVKELESVVRASNSCQLVFK